MVKNNHFSFEHPVVVHVPQGAAKLQAVELFSFFKNCTFLSMYHIFI